MILLRRLLGDVLRGRRQRQGRTLREVSGTARVSLGYLYEVERGQKEASSELLSAICTALDVPMSEVLRQVSDNMAAVESGVPYDALLAIESVHVDPAQVDSLRVGAGPVLAGAVPAEVAA